MENLNGQKANQLAIYNPGLSVEQGTIRKHETHLLIREGLDLGTTHAPLYYSNSLLKPKTFSALDHFRSIYSIRDMPYSTAKKQCKWNVLFSHEISPKARRNVCVKLRGLSKWSNLWIRNNIIVDFSMKDKVCSSKHIRGYMYICELLVTQHASRVVFFNWFLNIEIESSE